MVISAQAARLIRHTAGSRLNEKITGNQYVHNIPHNVPSNSGAEYPNCVNAVRAIKSRISLTAL